MHNTIKSVAAALLVGTATLAVAQTPADSFADQFKRMQSLQSMGTYTFKAPPTLQQKPDDPVGNQSFTDRFADMQAQSSNSGEFQAPPALSKQAANPEGKESFAQRFAEMQAASSNSGEWKASPSVVAPAYATAGSGAAVASQGQKLAPSRTAGVKRDEGATSSTGR